MVTLRCGPQQFDITLTTAGQLRSYLAHYRNTLPEEHTQETHYRGIDQSMALKYFMSQAAARESGIWLVSLTCLSDAT
jgi:hypothetical protein